MLPPSSSSSSTAGLSGFQSLCPAAASGTGSACPGDATFADVMSGLAPDRPATDDAAADLTAAAFAAGLILGVAPAPDHAAPQNLAVTPSPEVDDERGTADDVVGAGEDDAAGERAGCAAPWLVDADSGPGFPPRERASGFLSPTQAATNGDSPLARPAAHGDRAALPSPTRAAVASPGFASVGNSPRPAAPSEGATPVPMDRPAAGIDGGDFPAVDALPAQLWSVSEPALHEASSVDRAVFTGPIRLEGTAERVRATERRDAPPVSPGEGENAVAVALPGRAEPESFVSPENTPSSAAARQLLTPRDTESPASVLPRVSPAGAFGRSSDAPARADAESGAAEVAPGDTLVPDAARAVQVAAEGAADLVATSDRPGLRSSRGSMSPFVAQLGMAKFADQFRAASPRSDTQYRSELKKILTTEGEGFESDPWGVGTAVANLRTAMPYTTNLPAPAIASPGDLGVSGSVPAVVATAAVDARIPAESTLTASASGAAHAVEAVLDAAQVAAEARRGAVELRFEVGGNELQVRVDLRHDDVQATFRTESPELRQALAQEWDSVVTATAAAERGVRLLPAIFSSTSSQADSGQPGAHGFAGGDHSAAQREAWARRGDSPRGTGGGRLVAAADASASSSVAHGPRVALPTSRHLHLFA